MLISPSERLGKTVRKRKRERRKNVGRKGREKKEGNGESKKGERKLREKWRE